jgi:hypothetical protein
MKNTTLNRGTTDRNAQGTARNTFLRIDIERLKPARLKRHEAPAPRRAPRAIMHNNQPFSDLFPRPWSSPPAAITPYPDVSRILEERAS